MAKRIALKNNIFFNKKSFWIYKKLKRKGMIVGKYEVCFSKSNNKELIIREQIIPKLVEKLDDEELNFQASYNENDLTN